MGKRLGKSGMWAHARGATVVWGRRFGMQQRLMGQVLSERNRGEEKVMETGQQV